MTEHVVGDCYQCPCRLGGDFVGDSQRCNAKGRDIGLLPNEPQPPPDWCPLRQGPITIRLEDA